MSPNPTNGCELCELPTDNVGITDDAGNRFCCTGCRSVYHALGEVEDVSVDEVREHTKREPTDGLADIPDTHEITYLSVDGMYCTSCEAFIEAVATNTDGVSDAQSSYVTDTARIAYDPEVTSEAAIQEAVSGHGYRAYPRDDEFHRREADNWAFGRMAAGVLLGMAVMLQYVVIVYPTYFGGLFYDDRTATFLEDALATGGGRYFFIVIGVLTTIILLFTGKPILRGAYVSLRTRTPNMDLLVAIAAVSAYLYSSLAIVLGRTDIYYDVTVAVILVVTIGGYYEQSIKDRSMELLTDLTRVHANEANLFTDERVEKVPIEVLEEGDHVLLRAGERVPVDGVVTEGRATLDESVMTGESRPVEKTVGDTVVGGSLALEGSLTAQVSEGATNSFDRILELVWNLQSSTSGIQGLANTLATIFVPLVLVAATVVTAVYIGLGASLPGALLVGLTVLIVSCPCALGLATPMARAAGLRDALKNDIVVFDATVFERIRSADTVVFDKTGTLTSGSMTVIGSTISDDLLHAVARLERRVAHPIADAIVQEIPETNPTAESRLADGGTEVVAKDTMDDEVDDLKNHLRGVSGRVNGTEVVVGHPDLFDRFEWSLPAAVVQTYRDQREAGHIPVIAGRYGQAEGVIVLGDTPRSGWEETFERLADRGIEVVVLTGDEPEAAEKYRSHPAVRGVFAGVPPEGKAATVERLATQGTTVMVGDGTNDAPALAAADLGIALGSGTALAADAADVAIIDDDLRTVVNVFELASGAGRRVKQNIGWAFCYNAIALPVAIAGLLNPLIAALAMATSSVLVVSNSARPVTDEDVG